MLPVIAGSASSTAEFARLNERVSGLGALPLLLALPLGRMHAHVVLFQIILVLRERVRSMSSVRDRDLFGKLSASERIEYAKSCSQLAQNCRRGLAQIKEPKLHGPLARFLVAWFEKLANDVSDFAETFSLGSDLEMSSLVKELSDVL